MSVPGLIRRLCALFYDALLWMGVMFLLFLLPQMLIGFLLQKALPPLWLLVHLVAATLGYFVYFWTQGGQTLAMRSWRIRLLAVDNQDTPPDVRRAALRFLLAWMGYALCGVSVWWALFDRDRQFLHDRLSGTRLVLLPKAHAK